MIRVETTGSWWVFTDELYLRLPKQEGPRIDWDGIPRPEWGQTPGPALDGVWHKLVSWEYEPLLGGGFRLRIHYDDAECIKESCAKWHWIETGEVLSPIPEEVLEAHGNPDT